MGTAPHWPLGSGVCEVENLAVVGDCEETQDYIEWKTDDHGSWVELTGAPRTLGGNVTVPSQIGGKPVRRIGQDAFADCRDMTGVFIPATVESIGDCAFACCTSLRRLEIPVSVTIGQTCLLHDT